MQTQYEAAPMTPEAERRALTHRAVKLTFRWPIEQEGDKAATLFVPLGNGQPLVTLAQDIPGVSSAEHSDLQERLTDIALTKLAIL